MLDALKAEEKPISQVFAAPSLPQFPVASGFWLRIKVGLLAVYKNSKSRHELEAWEVAARREISLAA